MREPRTYTITERSVPRYSLDIESLLTDGAVLVTREVVETTTLVVSYEGRIVPLSRSVLIDMEVVDVTERVDALSVDDGCGPCCEGCSECGDPYAEFVEGFDPEPWVWVM